MSIYPQIIAPVTSPGGITDTARAVSDLQATENIIPAGSVSGTQIGAGTVGGANIAAGTITALNIQANTITAVQIATHTLTAAQIMAGTITATEIAAGAITAGTIAAGAITAGAIAAGAITAVALAAGSVTAAAIAAGAISAGDFSAGAVQANDIAAGAVTASKISVSSLSAVSGAMGTVTGGIFQTSNTGARVLMGTGLVTSMGTNNGIIGVDTGGNVTFFIDATTGNVTLKGTLQSGSNGLGNINGVTQNAILLAQGNLLNDNPTLATTDLTPFGGSGTASRDTSTFLTAPASLKAVLSAAGTRWWGRSGANFIPATAGQPYSAAVYVYSSIAQTLKVGIGFYNATPTLIGSIDYGATVSVLANQWTRLYVENLTSPALTNWILCWVDVPNASTVWLDNMLTVNQLSAQGSMILADTVTATEINVGVLSAISSNIGTITAGTIVGGTIGAVNIIGANYAGGIITGAVIQTAATGARTVLDAAGVKVYSSGGADQIAIDPVYGLSMAGGGANYNQITWAHGSATGVLLGLTNAYTTSSSNYGMQMQLTSPASNTASGFVILATDSASDTNNYIVATIHNAAMSAQYTAKIIDGQGFTYLNNVVVGTVFTNGGIQLYGNGVTAWSTGGSSSNPYGFVFGGETGATAGSGGSPANSIRFAADAGSLPGFPSNTYPTVKTDYSSMFFSVFGSYSAALDSSGVLHAVSSENEKNGITDIDPDDLLDKISALRLHEWEFNNNPGVRRIGPFAEDFSEKFGLGPIRVDPSDRTDPMHGAFLAPSDVAGVALAGVQALKDRVEDLEAHVSVRDVLDTLAAADDFASAKAALLALVLQKTEADHFDVSITKLSPQSWMSDNYMTQLDADEAALAADITDLQTRLAALQATQ